MSIDIYSMAGREVGIGALKCALTSISPSRLLFGTDWPFNYDYNPQGVKQYVEEVKGLGLPPESVEAILSGNAAKLLGI